MSTANVRLMALRHRGVALLIVLAMIILVVPIAVGLAQQAVYARLDHELSVDEDTAQCLRQQLETGPISHWLSTDAANVVLDPESATPRIEVLHEWWEFEQTPYEVCVTAWDEYGMVPFDSARHQSSLSSTLPAEIRDRMNRAEIPKDTKESMGLDQFDDRELKLVYPHHSAFPHSNDDPSALGAWVATHATGSPAAINVNTAPLPLLEAAMQLAGRGGIEAIVEARRSGKQSSLPATFLGSSESNDSKTNQTPRFVSVSSCWAVRIDVHVGLAHRSWWVVYHNRSGKWECVQRLVITD